LWILHLVILRGVRGAAVLNAVTTFAKIVPLLAFIALAVTAFRSQAFEQDFWGTPKLGSVFAQVKSTMLITVWVFIGIEGASVVSARAEHRQDVGRATLYGFAIVLLLLMAVSLLSPGIVPQAELAAMKNPSMAGVLEKAVGTWGAVMISLGLLVSVGGALLAWTLLAAETLFTPASGGVMPRFLSRENDHGVPANALWVTNGLVQLFLIVTLVSSATYQALISLATSMSSSPICSRLSMPCALLRAATPMLRPIECAPVTWWSRCWRQLTAAGFCTRQVQNICCSARCSMRPAYFCTDGPSANRGHVFSSRSKSRS
jgi:arginine:ornithine antiporter/lysine permease